MFLSIDVGNQRIKLTLFVDPVNLNAVPLDTFAVSGEMSAWQSLDAWWSKTLPDLLQGARLDCWMTSVEQTTSSNLLEHLQQTHAVEGVRTLAWQDFSLQIAFDKPEAVGVDRLAAACAAHRLAQSDHAAIVVDFGSAITVDRVSASGQFEGGAILAGSDLAAGALHRCTDALPRIEMTKYSNAPELPGKSTEEAIAAGLYWGSVGAVRELIERQSQHLDPSPTVFVTGGAAETLAPHLGKSTQYEPHLVARGIALAGSESDK